ncbi:MAG: hypothetical protein A2Y10_01790 [Planctomycetes bacterium GWF2_41_51]|nr:MAG: hypothetical protein A2Y10_01790 [Planctomycetes bacterium GWF2_41_51]HBG26329.1 hypothetical protein [Phycisphaerales bacterium]
MKNITTILIVLTALLASGCQQSQQTSTNIARKEKLIAAAMMNLKAELAQNKKEIEKQGTLLEQCKQNNEKLTSKTAAQTNEINNLKTALSQTRASLDENRKQLENCENMLDAKDSPALCKDRIERQQKLLEECQKEKADIEKAAGDSASFLMEQLPTELLKETERLNAENEQLKAKIEELEKSK